MSDTIEIVSMPRRTGYVGRTADGRRVWLELELRGWSRSGESVEHQPVTGYTELSVCASGLDKGSKRGIDIDFGGQCDDAVAEVVRPAPGWTVAELAEVVEVWHRWHLNGVKAGCVHLAGVTDTKVECPVQAADPDIEEPYRWGHAWLIEPLPSDVITQVRAWAAKLDGSYPC